MLRVANVVMVMALLATAAVVYQLTYASTADAERLAYALPRARKKIEPVHSDPDANYSAVHDVDLDDLEPRRFR